MREKIYIDGVDRIRDLAKWKSCAKAWGEYDIKYIGG